MSLINHTSSTKKGHSCGYEPYEDVSCTVRAVNSAGVSNDSNSHGRSACAGELGSWMIKLPLHKDGRGFVTNVFSSERLKY